MITSIRGFNDILPEDAKLWQQIEACARDVFKTYGFSEIRIPILERTELFSRSIGSATDIVEKEMYTFLDRNNESLTMRPEGTASVVRAYIEHKLYNLPSQRFYYLGPMFRYERPQKGRYRQFYQIGSEVFSDDSPRADAETIDMLLCLFDKLDLGSLELGINSLGCKNCRPSYRNRLKGFLSDKRKELCENCQRRMDANPLRAIDCKSPKCVEITKDAPSILGSICDECRMHFEDLKRYLALFGRQYSINQRMVRGLDYYTRTTFEVTSNRLGAQNAVAAGGRYDGLVKELGGHDISGFGFAIGMERLVLLLKETGAKVEQEPIIFLISLGKMAEIEAIRILKKLRENGVVIEMGCQDKGIKGQMKVADKMSARFALILGDDELARKEITLKDMKTGEQDRVKIEGLVRGLKTLDMKK